MKVWFIVLSCIGVASSIMGIATKDWRVYGLALALFAIILLLTFSYSAASVP